MIYNKVDKCYYAKLKHNHMYRYIKSNRKVAMLECSLK